MADWFDELEFRKTEQDAVYYGESRLTLPNGHWALLQIRRYSSSNRTLDVMSSIHVHSVGPLTYAEAKRLLYELKHSNIKPLNSVPPWESVAGF